MKAHDTNVAAKAVAAWASIFAMMVANPAQADDITVEIDGEIEASCEITGLGASTALGELSASSGTTLDFTVDCNAPFAYALVSDNLGFARQSGAAPIGGSDAFATLLPYNITASFTTDDAASFGDTALVSTNLTAANAADCIAASYNAAGCPFTDSGSAIAANPSGTNASLAISWDAAGSSDPLAAGTYLDILTITVRAQ